jgi:DNA-directed RNA polymerase specialized sigma subunit
MHEFSPKTIEDRVVAYESLFNGELPYNTMPEEADIGIAGLWRAFVCKDGRTGDDLALLLDNVPGTVQEILTYHQHASSQEDGNAVFGLLYPEVALPIVTGITTRIMTLWEKALYRHGEPSMLTTKRDATGDLSKEQSGERLAHLLASQQLVVETAAAVVQVLPLWVKDLYKPSKNSEDGVAKILASWGPQFLTEWMNGTIIGKWLDTMQLSEAERQDWNELFNDSTKKRFAVGNISDPLKALGRVKDHLEVTLSDENIAKELGWSVEDVRQIFTNHMKKRFAVSNIANPLKALGRVKEHLGVTLSDENIAEELGWNIEEVRQMFTDSMKKNLAVSNISDPLKALGRVKDHLEVTLSDENIAKELGWSVEEARNMFTDGMKRRFAVKNISDPLKGIQGWLDGKTTLDGRDSRRVKAKAVRTNYLN